ncbi:MAG: acetyl-CoA decarbonylase/synthase complex subunit delta [Deltaproteobacteria bacterium]|nr:MAG: acetyl-CoA decarbonylase/synthase complex subunit delta [Deltaproteobacteria bacterium]
MAVDLPKRTYSGSIKTVTVGQGDKAFTVGGETAFPFYTFEGEMPHAPRLGLNVLDIEPDDSFAPALAEAYGDAVKDPAEWAKKCVELGADVVQVTLKGTDPNDKNLGPDHAVEVVKKVVEAVDVPVSVWGTANVEKDAEVLRAVAEAMDGKRLCIGPVQEENHKQLGAACLAYKHVAIASSPIDINLAKQLNVLLGNLGVPDENILIDPTVGGLGYGMEYTYSVMERARMAALMQQDERLQFPIYCNVGSEVWKTKETKLPDGELKMGKMVERGVLMECTTATALLAAGADIVVLCHPRSLELVRKLVEDLQKN